MLSVWFKNRDTMRYPHHMALEKSINIGLEDHPTNPPWGMGSPILHHKLGVAVSQNGATPSYHICYHPFIDWIFPWNIMKSKTIPTLIKHPLDEYLVESKLLNHIKPL